MRVWVKSEKAKANQHRSLRSTDKRVVVSCTDRTIRFKVRSLCHRNNLTSRRRGQSLVAKEKCQLARWRRPTSRITHRKLQLYLHVGQSECSRRDDQFRNRTQGWSHGLRRGRRPRLTGQPSS